MPVIDVDQWGNDLLQLNRPSPIASAQIRRTAIQSMAADLLEPPSFDPPIIKMDEWFFDFPVVHYHHH